MKYDVYFPAPTKEGLLRPSVKATEMSIFDILELMKTPDVGAKIKAVREDGDKEKKSELPAVCWMGKSTTGRRSASVMVPTQLVMVDIDHVEDPYQSFVTLSDRMLKKNEVLVLAHRTPSGKGLRLIVRATETSFSTVVDYLDYLDKEYHFSEFGDFDKKCKDLSRLSFLCLENDVYYLNSDVLDGKVNFDVAPIKSFGNPYTPSSSSKSDGLFASNEVAVLTDSEIEDFSSRSYRGTVYGTIVAKYLEVYGEPGTGERHNYYNEMVKNFRTICDNDKRFLLWLLPDFGHSLEERWSQITNICRVNTLSRIPRDFYFFLVDNGYYGERGSSRAAKEMLNDTEPAPAELPEFLPPVFKQLLRTAPRDFVEPCVNALLPILGTLTSYLRATYPYDNREHSTSFFSVIYAPAGTGKGFVERFLDLLFKDLSLRDLVQSERENVYLRVLQKKGANDKAPDMPHVSLRVIPPKNSEPEFLQKQRDNEGFHMFTYAAEMDSWAKGVKAAGGNKDDMIRIAWDNGEYGQQFKSANTFKGMVRLYWNVLITGTIAQVENYFKNVENGLVTRCSFTSIDNQEFCLPPKWKKLSKRDLEVINRFLERCDRRTYTEPCNVDIFELNTVGDDEFDDKIDWRFHFRDKMHVDMSWIMPTIEAFHEEQVRKSALDVDRARDTFRRRVGVRGFRLGLLCYGLYEKPTAKDLESCAKFIDWWMHRDLENSLKLWGERYNQLTDVENHIAQRCVYDQLQDDFTRNDLYAVCVKMGIRTPVRRIIHEWTKINVVQKLTKDDFKKVKK